MADLKTVEQKMIGKFLDAVREYEREVNNGQEKS